MKDDVVYEKCYGYDSMIGICLLYGIPCLAAKQYECYHTSKEEAVKKNLAPK